MIATKHELVKSVIPNHDEYALPCSLKDSIGGARGVPEVTCFDLGLCRAH